MKNDAVILTEFVFVLQFLLKAYFCRIKLGLIVSNHFHSLIPPVSDDNDKQFHLEYIFFWLNQTARCTTNPHEFLII